MSEFVKTEGLQHAESGLVPDPKPTAVEQGILPDGRKVMRLQAGDPQVYGFAVVNPRSETYAVPGDVAQREASYISQMLGGDIISETPQLFAVITRPTEIPNGDRNKQVLFADVHSAAQRATLESSNEHYDLSYTDIAAAVPLEGDLAMTVTAESKPVIVNIVTGEQFKPHYRRCSTYDLSGKGASHIAPAIGDVEDQRWRDEYGQRVWRGILQGTIPPDANGLTQLANLTFQRELRMQPTLSDMINLLTNNPASEFWNNQVERVTPVAKTVDGKGNVLSTPPHLGILSDSDRRIYAAIERVMADQDRVYRILTQVANNGTPIHPDDIARVRATATEDQIVETLNRVSLSKKERGGKHEDASRNHLSRFGVPHVWMGMSDAEMIDDHTTQYETSILPIGKDLKGSSGRNGGEGMFTKSARSEHVVPNPREFPHIIDSEVEPNTIIEAMRKKVTEPLFKVETAETDPEGLSNIVMGILLDPRVENRGNNVRTKEGEATMREKVKTAIQQGKPIDLLVFGPLGTAPSPLRSGGRKQPHLGHLDFLTQFLRINTTVEQVYKPEEKREPAIRINWINESGAFVPHIDIRPLAQIREFEDGVVTTADALAPERDILSIGHMEDYIWGTPERKALFDEFRANYTPHTRSLFDAFEDDPESLTDEQRKWVMDRYQLIYPIATIVDPYNFVPKSTSLSTIALAYEAVRRNVIGGDDPDLMERVKNDSNASDVAERLKHAAREIVITQYVPTMDSRYETSRFVSPESAQRHKEIDPWQPLYEGKIHSRITDGGTNRLWLKLNSGKSTVHPTHGVTVVNAPLVPGREPQISIRTYAEVASEPHKYAPVFMNGDETDAPFHYLQIQ